MVDSEFSVLLWSKALVLDLDQAEQKVPALSSLNIELDTLSNQTCRTHKMAGNKSR